MIDWVTILISTVTSSSIVAISLVILGFIAKSLYGQVLSKDLEIHKSSLERVAHEHSVKFESLHAKRAEVISEVYTRIVFAENLSFDMLNVIDNDSELPLGERYKHAKESLSELAAHFEFNRLYFEDKTCKKVDEIIKRMGKVLKDYVPILKAVESEDLNEEHFEVWKHSFNIILKDIPPIKKEIEIQFRTLLGIENSTIE